MSDLQVRALGGVSNVPSEAPHAGIRPPQPTTVEDLRDDQPRDYLVFADKWSTARLTVPEVARLVAQGYRVQEDRAFVVPEPAPSTDVPDALANVHEALDLNALGPEWEGEGGLFISVDSGVAPHRDLPPTDHFDNVFTDAPEDPQADAGTHGTHTTGSAIGRGDPAQGGVRGAAPRARLDAVQVLDVNGRGTESSVLRGLERAIEWARAHDGFVVINLSLSGLPATIPANDPLVQTMERATREHGILFSVSAGNEGPFPGTLGRLGLAPNAVTVGALDHKGTLDPSDDRIAIFSSRGNGWEGKPNIVARGVGVRSSVPGNGYATYKGTSMASGIAGGGLLALGQGLLAMYRRGDLRVDPRELVRSGEFQRIIAEASYDNPRISRDAEGSGDLRLMKAREIFVQRFSVATKQGPAPYFPNRASALPDPGYRVPF